MSNLSQIKCVALQVFDFDLSEDEMSQITTLNKDYRLSTEDM
jgi:diketogulonate reductase-like aldo/keto reductase